MCKDVDEIEGKRMNASFEMHRGGSLVDGLMDWGRGKRRKRSGRKTHVRRGSGNGAQRTGSRVGAASPGDKDWSGWTLCSAAGLSAQQSGHCAAQHRTCGSLFSGPGMAARHTSASDYRAASSPRSATPRPFRAVSARKQVRCARCRRTVMPAHCSLNMPRFTKCKWLRAHFKVR